MKSGKSLHDNIAVQFMNSIFTNALPGENEDAHTYTLKERFNQANEESQGNNNKINNNNNGGGNMHGYENNQNEKQMLPELHQRDNFKDYNDQNNMQDYSHSHYYNRSRSVVKVEIGKGVEAEIYIKEAIKEVGQEVIVEIIEEVVLEMMIIEKGEEIMKEIIII